MSRVRRCDDRCHEALGSRCKCWCGGFYHGASGSDNRGELDKAVQFLDEHGGGTGHIYLEQRRLKI